MMSRGRHFCRHNRPTGRNITRRTSTTLTDPIRNPTASRFSEDDEDSSDFETISSSRTYSVNEDHGDTTEDSSDVSGSESDDYYYYSYVTVSDLASDGASIHSEESSTDDEELSDEEPMEEEEEEQLGDWTKPVRLAKTCHVLTENVVREMLSNDYTPQWFDVVDLVLEKDEQTSKGPAEPEFYGDNRAIQDPAKDFSKLINKELLRNEQVQMSSLVHAAPESTRLEITATTLFAPKFDYPATGTFLDME